MFQSHHTHRARCTVHTAVQGKQSHTQVRRILPYTCMSQSTRRTSLVHCSSCSHHRDTHSRTVRRSTQSHIRNDHQRIHRALRRSREHRQQPHRGTQRCSSARSTPPGTNTSHSQGCTGRDRCMAPSPQSRDTRHCNPDPTARHRTHCGVSTPRSTSRTTSRTQSRSSCRCSAERSCGTYRCDTRHARCTQHRPQPGIVQCTSTTSTQAHTSRTFPPPNTHDPRPHSSCTSRSPHHTFLGCCTALHLQGTSRSTSDQSVRGHTRNALQCTSRTGSCPPCTAHCSRHQRTRPRIRCTPSRSDPTQPCKRTSSSLRTVLPRKSARATRRNGTRTQAHLALPRIGTHRFQTSRPYTSRPRCTQTQHRGKRPVVPSSTHTARSTAVQPDALTALA